MTYINKTSNLHLYKHIPPKKFVAKEIIKLFFREKSLLTKGKSETRPRLTTQSMSKRFQSC